MPTDFERDVLQRLSSIEANDQHKITYRTLLGGIAVLISAILGGNFLIQKSNSAEVQTQISTEIDRAMQESNRKVAAAIEKQFELQRDSILEQLASAQSPQMVQPFLEYGIPVWAGVKTPGASMSQKIFVADEGAQAILKSDVEKLVSKWESLQETASYDLKELYIQNDFGEFVPAFPDVP